MILFHDLTNSLSAPIRLGITCLFGVIIALNFDFLSLADHYSNSFLEPYLLQVALYFLATALFVISMHSMNLIDGVNGLCGINSVLIFFSLSVVGLEIDQADISALSMLLAVLSMGFLLFNFPVSRLFLGDMGAYFLGFWVIFLMLMLAVETKNFSLFLAYQFCFFCLIMNFQGR